MNCSVAFWKPNVQVKENVAFQISLAAPESVHISNLPFTSLSISFSDGFAPVTVSHDDNLAGQSKVRGVNLGAILPMGAEGVDVVQANLRWQAGGTVVFYGSMSSDAPKLLEVTFMTFCSCFDFLTISRMNRSQNSN